MTNFSKKTRVDSVVIPGSPTTQRFLVKSTGIRQA